MHERFDIRVIATDGSNTKKILWIKRTKDHICYGWDVPKEGEHFTYHKDGNVSYEDDRARYNMGQKIPLLSFQGTVHVMNMGIVKDLTVLRNVDFDYKKVDGLVYIDLRTLDQSRNIFNVDLQFVEAGKIESIYCFPEYSSIHIFKFSNPWVVISIGCSEVLTDSITQRGRA